MDENCSHDEESGHTANTVTRRRFLSASGTALTLSVTMTGNPHVETAPLSEVVLRESDLEVTAVGYTDLTGEPADAALIRHLRTAVPGFSEEAVALSAFTTTPDAPVPTHVESAAIARGGGWDPDHLARAIDAWLRGEDRPAVSLDVDGSRGPRELQWRTVSQQGTVDVTRLYVTRAGPVLLTVAHGDSAAELDPQTAVDRYEATMRDRVVAE